MKGQMPSFITAASCVLVLENNISEPCILRVLIFYVIFLRNGCATSEDLFWKLDALQSFISDLHWPDMEFRQHLEQRLKLMACDMIESCIQRTESTFQQWLKKSVTFISTDYIIPTEMCAMVNVILDAKNQAFKLCAVDGIDVVSDLLDNLPFSLIKPYITYPYQRNQICV